MAVPPNPMVTYRPARVDDYQRVLDIDKNFMDGLHYLEATYRHWVHAPRYYLCVAQVNDILVSI